MYSQEPNDDSCSSDHTGVTLYFNDATVQEQLHVQKMKWEPCSDHIGSTYKKDRTTVHLFENFKKAGLKVLLYSGNIDAQVSYVETEEYIRQIGWKVTEEKKVLQNDFGSLEGWVTGYDGLTFYVINAAGHMVPHDKPAAAYRMF
jgi:carboxypeptidase C (cathepsin A)